MFADDWPARLFSPENENQRPKKESRLESKYYNIHTASMTEGIRDTSNDGEDP